MTREELLNDLRGRTFTLPDYLYPSKLEDAVVANLVFVIEDPATFLQRYEEVEEGDVENQTASDIVSIVETDEEIENFDDWGLVLNGIDF